ncbi:MAG: RHS repeat protein [Chlamydiia bacterium]|nr:RHS repeat protein [Chlamydiia bacterium]
MYDRLIREQFPDDHSITYQYDYLDRVTSLKMSDGSGITGF